MIQKLPKRSTKAVLKLYNQIWLNSDFPLSWWHSVVLPVLKPGKHPLNQNWWNKKLSYHRVTARCVVSVEILPITTQQYRNYLYDKSWTNGSYEVKALDRAHTTSYSTLVETVSIFYRFPDIAGYLSKIADFDPPHRSIENMTGQTGEPIQTKQLLQMGQLVLGGVEQ